MECPNCKEWVERGIEAGTAKDGRHYVKGENSAFVHWCKAEFQPDDYIQVQTEHGRQQLTKKERIEREAEDWLHEAGFEDPEEAPASLRTLARQAAGGKTSAGKLFLQQARRLKPTPRSSDTSNDRPKVELRLSDAAVEQVLEAMGHE